MCISCKQWTVVNYNMYISVLQAFGKMQFGVQSRSLQASCSSTVALQPAPVQFNCSGIKTCCTQPLMTSSHWRRRTKLLRSKLASRRTWKLKWANSKNSSKTRTTYKGCRKKGSLELNPCGDYALLAQEMKQSNQQWKSRFEALEMCLSEEQAHSKQSWRRKLEEMENEKSQLCVPCGLKRRRTGRKVQPRQMRRSTSFR